MAYLPKTTAWDALQEIANAALCKVFVDREDRIHLRSEETESLSAGIEINPSNMFSYKSTGVYLCFVSYLNAASMKRYICRLKKPSSETGFLPAAGISPEITFNAAFCDSAVFE